MQKNTIDTMAKYYLITTTVYYCILCIFIGHPLWIFSVFVKNFILDLTNETPRMLSSMFHTIYVSNYELVGQRRFLVNNFNNAVLAGIPAAFQFVCIDTFISKKIEKKDFGTKCCSFLSAYVLQAVIAVSWSGSVTWDIFSKFVVSNLISVLFSAVMLIMAGYLVYNLFILRNENLYELICIIIVIIVNVLMTPVYALFTEIFKIVILILLYGLSITLISMVLNWMNLAVLVHVFAIFYPFCFIWMNRKLSKISGFLSGILMNRLIQDANPGYQKSFLGELFCVFLALFSIICCFWLQIRMK